MTQAKHIAVALAFAILAGCDDPPPDLAMERFSEAVHELAGEILDEAAVLHVCQGAPLNADAINAAIVRELDPAADHMIAASQSDAERSRRVAYARLTRDTALSLTVPLLDSGIVPARSSRQMLMDEGATGAATCRHMEAMARTAVAAATVNVRSLAKMNALP